MEEEKEIDVMNDVETFRPIAKRGRPRIREEDRKLSLKRAQKRYYEKNREKIAKYARERYYENKDKNKI
jgi:hypothetical protein